MWFQVDFRKWTKITGIKIQGAADEFDVIQTFSVSYSSDGIQFQDFTEYDQVKVGIKSNRYPDPYSEKTILPSAAPL